MEENLSESFKEEIPYKYLKHFKPYTLKVVIRSKCMYTLKTIEEAQRILDEKMKEGK